MNTNYTQFLDWPFLAFILILLFGVFFHAEIRRLLKRSNVLVPWDEGEIDITELKERIDLEVERLEEAISRESDPVGSELEVIRQAVMELQRQVPDAATIALKPVISDDAATIEVGADKDAVNRIEETLKEGRWRWRTIERLAIIGGCSVDQAHIILSRNKNVVTLKGRNGVEIARHISR